MDRAFHGKKDKSKKDKSSQGIQCHECSKFRHIRADCSNYKKFKGKTMNVALSDESDFDDSNKPDDKNENFMALNHSLKSLVNVPQPDWEE